MKKKFRILIRGFEHKSVDDSARRIIQVARKSGSKVKGPIPLPNHKEIITVLRGVHKHKDSREQFEKSEHKRLIVVYPNSKTIDQLSKIVLPSSVSLFIKTVLI